MGLRNPTSEPKIRWRQLNGFQNYEISEEGKVRNIQTGRILKATHDSRTHSHLSLYIDGVSYCKRPEVLVKMMFGKKL